MVELAPAFIRRIVDVFGDSGTAWVAGLPALLAQYAERHGLSLGAPFEPLSYNYVAPVLLPGGEEGVLKAGVPGAEFQCEVAALRIYDGRAAVRLLDSDVARGIMVLERVRPGVPLEAVPDDAEATRIAAQVMQRLWRPVPAGHTFPTNADWLRGFERLRRAFEGGAGPFPPRLVDMAEDLAGELLPTSAEPVLLHGDLHHGNILSSEREGWLAIDPKGLVGEPAYEVGSLLRNPTPHYLAWPGIDRIMAQRVDILADACGFERRRVAGWGLAQAVLSAWWSYEDHEGGWEPAIACAELLAPFVE